MGIGVVVDGGRIDPEDVEPTEASFLGHWVH
jgi:hypothetical protein